MEMVKKLLQTRSGTLILLIICFALLILSNAGVIDDIYSDYRRKSDSIQTAVYNGTLKSVEFQSKENYLLYEHLRGVFKEHQMDDIRFKDRLDIRFDNVDNKQDEIIKQLERLIGALHGQGIRVAESD